MKKAFFLLSLFLAVFVLSGCGPKRTTGADLPEAQPTPYPTRPIEQTIKERPFVSLVPTSDRHWVTLEVKNISGSVTGLLYELTYMAEFEEGKIERGVTSGSNPVELSGASEYSKKILFGSASCTTGVCKYKYDENVSEGVLVLELQPGERYETVYRIQKGSEAKEGLSTGDGVFSYVSSILPAKGIYLTISTIGVPVSLPEGVVPKSVPYGIFPTVTGAGKVSITTAATEGSIYAYNGKSWQKLITTIANGTATAQSSSTSIFILAE
jgi:hypothetical protein